MAWRECLASGFWLLATGQTWAHDCVVGVGVVLDEKVLGLGLVDQRRLESVVDIGWDGVLAACGKSKRKHLRFCRERIKSQPMKRTLAAIAAKNLLAASETRGGDTRGRVGCHKAKRWLVA